jgi:hypothetical protein
MSYTQFQCQGKNTVLRKQLTLKSETIAHEDYCYKILHNIIHTYKKWIEMK